MADWQTFSDRINNVAPSATLAVDSKAKAMKAAGVDVIGFGAGEPDFPTPADVVDAAVKACNDPRNYKYTPTAGLPELREAIAAKVLRDSGYEVTADQVVVTNGGKQAVYESFQVLLNDGDEVIIPTPFWTSYPEAVKLAGGKPVEVFAGADRGFEPDIAAIEAEAAKLRAKADLIICIGIGGSYLGAKAVLEAMSNPFKLLHREQKQPTVVFAGQNISEDYIHELLEVSKEHSIAAIVISKSGTTTEPAIAFRLIKAEIEKRYGKQEAAERIVAITDQARGALKTLATQEGYPTFVIPDDVGGRFSVLTPVGLLPLAVAGVDIAALVRGAQEMEKATAEGVAFKENPAAVYAAVRNILYDGGKKIEILGSYEPKLQYINEWWKQLYGESEGKQGKGIWKSKEEFSNPYNWSGYVVGQILSKPEYMGHTVNFRSHKQSYKDKNAVMNPKEDRLIFENTHEAILDRETWSLHKSSARRPSASTRWVRQIR